MVIHTVYRGEAIYKTTTDDETEYFVYLLTRRGEAVKKSSKDLLMLCEMINEVLNDCT